MLESGQLETRNTLYRAVWRWHFFAGLLVLPFLVLLSVTGGLYLFKNEIDHFICRSMQDVPARSAPMLPATLLMQRAAEATHGQVLQLTMPEEPTQAVRMIIRTGEHASQTTFVDPYDGRLLGVTAYGGVMQIVRKLHSLQYFGFWASCLIEITAGWTIVLVFSGLYLWWPRGQRGGVVTLRATPKTRVFWRDLHAVTGLFASLAILFLAVTGMPWSKVWGKYVQQWTTAAGLGQPEAPAEVLREWALGRGEAGTAKASHHHDHGADGKADLPWALEQASAPASAPSTSKAPAITLDEAIAIFTKAGLPKPFSVALPLGPRGAYMGSYRPDRVEETRVVYLDQNTGRVLGDIGFAQYGPAAKSIEWGIAVHQGQEYGLINRYVMLGGCVAILLLAGSAPIMWWKRRPKGSFAIPPAADRRTARGVLGIMGVTGLLFPLLGLSIIAALFCEQVFALVRRHRSSRSYSLRT